MSVTIQLPSEVERTFREAWSDRLDQKTYEALVIQGYREKVLSVGRIAELMGLCTSLQADKWLADRRVERNLDEAELLKDFSGLHGHSSLHPKL